MRIDATPPRPIKIWAMNGGPCDVLSTRETSHGLDHFLDLRHTHVDLFVSKGSIISGLRIQFGPTEKGGKKNDIQMELNDNDALYILPIQPTQKMGVAGFCDDSG